MKLFKNGRSKLSRRITWRVILILLIFNLFIIGAVFLFDLAISIYESKTRSQNLINGIEGKLETMLKAVEVTATNNVAEIEANLDSPQKVIEALKHELRLNTHYLGCAVALEPDYFASQGRWFEPYVKFQNESSGKAEPGDSIQIVHEQIGSARHDYFNQEWYKKGFSMERGEGYLSDPYFDDAGGKRLLSSYVTPIFDPQGRKVGVFGIDLNLDWLEKTIINEEEKVKETSLLELDPNNPYDNENVFFIQIIDRKGKKIAGSETFDDEVLKTIIKEDSIHWKKIKKNDATYSISSKRLYKTGWTLVVAQHKDFVLVNGYALGIIILFFTTIGGIVMFFFTSRSIRRAIKPLRFLSKSAKEVAQGNFDTPMPSFKHQDEIAQLRDSFESMQQSLKQYVEELKVSTAEKASIDSELNVAQSIQMSMLPKTYPPFPNRNDIELYGMQKPAKAVGGDLYDFFIHDEKLFFCIGDVSGKGVPASLVMAVTRTLFRNVAAHTAEPSHIVEAMNVAISESNDNNMFVTLFVGMLDLHTGHLRYCNAGHDAPVIIENGKSDILECDSNLPLGVMPDWTFTEQEIKMTPDDIIFLYTDGLTEAENIQLEQFGEERIANIVTTFKGSPQDLIKSMVDAVRLFVGDTEQNDDLTMLAIKYTNTESI